MVLVGLGYVVAIEEVPIHMRWAKVLSRYTIHYEPGSSKSQPCSLWFHGGSLY